MICAVYVLIDKLCGITDADAKALDAVYLAFGYYDYKTESIALDAEKAAYHTARLKKANPHLKIVLSLGGLEGERFILSAGTPGDREKFATACSSVCAALHFDGIDLDFEHLKTEDESHSFTALVRQIREKLPPPLTLSITAVCEEWFAECIEVGEIAEYTDCIFLMTYDMRLPGQTAAHHTALYKSATVCDNMCAADYIRQLELHGVRRGKIAIGAAFYSRIWHDVPAGEHFGLGNFGSAGSGDYGPLFSALEEEYINKNGFVLHRDNGSPYLYNEETRTFISFDDTDSVCEKVEFAKNNGLYGVLCWEYSCDAGKTLLRALCRGK